MMRQSKSKRALALAMSLCMVAAATATPALAQGEADPGPENGAAAQATAETAAPQAQPEPAPAPQPAETPAEDTEPEAIAEAAVETYAAAAAPVIPGYTQYTANELDESRSYLAITRDSDSNIYALYLNANGAGVNPGALNAQTNGYCGAKLTVNGETVTASYLKDDSALALSDLQLTVAQTTGGYTFAANGYYLQLGTGMFSTTAQTLSVSSNRGNYAISTGSRILSFNRIGDTLSQYPGAQYITDFWGPSGATNFPVYLYVEGEWTPGPTPPPTMAEGKPAGGTTQDQPFENGTGGSDHFRIPALATLPDGTLFAAIDARWNHMGDACALDTIVSTSKDDGKTWNYSFANYFNDSTNAKDLHATAFIDPVVTVDKDGAIYMMVDLFPGGVAINTAPTQPDAASGYIEIDGKQRMVLYGSTTGQSDSSYTHYVGDFAAGYAPVYAKGGTVAEYYVDDHYYLYDTDKKALICPQLGSSNYVNQNVFFYNADLHVRNATYLWMTKSTDQGQTWSAPTILNPQVGSGSGGQMFYGVGPGSGICLADGTIVFPCYTFGNQIASFVYSPDGGTTWHRSPDATSGGHWSSESSLVQLDGTTLRHFYRDGYSKLYYTDFKWDATGQSWTPGTPVDTGVTKTSNNQLSSIRYSKTVGGKTAILVSTATAAGGSRQNGKIYVFTLKADKTMDLAYTYAVNQGSYSYSSLTELKDGSIGLLYEGNSQILYEHFAMDVIAPGAVLDGARGISLELYRSFSEAVAGAGPTAAELAELDASIIQVEQETASGVTTVTYTAVGEGTTSFSFGGLTYNFTVTTPATTPVALDLTNPTTSIEVEEGEIQHAPDASIATAVIDTDTKTQQVHGIQGNLGTDAAYTGSAAPASDALYTFTKDNDGKFVISAKAQDGTKVYLAPSNGSAAGFPNATAAMLNTVEASTTETGTFTILDAVGRYLHFYRTGGKNVFDRVTTLTNFEAACNFMIFAPAAQSATPTAPLPGYEQITDAADIVSGGTYLIVAKVGDAYYALNPSASTSSKYTQVMKLNPASELVDTTLTSGKTYLKITAVGVGTTDVMHNDVIYRVTVTGKPAQPTPTPMAPGKPAGGTTQDQPFENGTGGSSYFRIPALVTLPDGTQFAAIDARWDHTGDACALDTIVSTSKDDGKTWNYSYANYFNDSTDAKNLYATSFIDPVVTAGKDGTIYMMTDLFPSGIGLNTAPHQPDAASGYIEIDGKQRMVLYGSTTGQSDSNYTHYVGDFAAGYAPVYAKGGTVAEYYVDDHYYLYDTDKKALICPQLGSSNYVNQNVFFYNADLHVRNATYLWMTKSTDQGQTWSAPTILNPQVGSGSGGQMFYGVGPGSGICLADGTVVFPCYTFGNQIASFVYSPDGGTTWHRSPNATSGAWSSESSLVQLDDTTLRHFYRDGNETLHYTDMMWDADKQSWTAGPSIDTGVKKTTNNQLSSIRYSKLIDGKDAILVSTAASGSASRTNGKIYLFTLNADKTMKLAYTYSVTPDAYSYSSITERADGSIAVLYETGPDFTYQIIKYQSFAIEEIAPQAVVGGARAVDLSLYGTYSETVTGTGPTSEELAALDAKIIELKTEAAGAGKTKLTFTAVGEGSTGFTFGGMRYNFTVAPAVKEQIPLSGATSNSLEVQPGEIQRAPDSSVATAVIETVTTDKNIRGIQGNLGTDKNYTGEAAPASAALYTFTAGADGKFEIAGQAGGGTKVYLAPANGAAGYPNAAASVLNTLAPGSTEYTFTIKDSKSFLHFWRTGGKNVFDRVDNPAKYGEACDFMLFAPVTQSNGKASSPLPGYEQITDAADIVSGGTYLIVAKVGDAYYALNPSTSTTSQYAQVMKLDPTSELVDTTLTTSKSYLKITAVGNGETDVMVNGIIYHIIVTGITPPTTPPTDTPTQTPPTETPTTPPTATPTVPPVGQPTPTVPPVVAPVTSPAPSSTPAATEEGHGDIGPAKANGTWGKADTKPSAAQSTAQPKASAKIPQTGDNLAIEVLGFLAIFGLAGAGIALHLRKKQK